MREQYRAVAYVVKTHGKQGEVVITPIHNLPSVIARDMTVIPVPSRQFGSVCRHRFSRRRKELGGKDAFGTPSGFASRLCTA